jgi:hypothetical protein
MPRSAWTPLRSRFVTDSDNDSDNDSDSDSDSDSR